MAYGGQILDSQKGVIIMGILELAALVSAIAAVLSLVVQIIELILNEHNKRK